MTEEKVTKYLLKWLIEKNWQIICYDFPQSGTGRFLHPNGNSSKNEDSMNPDIVAVRDNVCIWFENKDRFYYPDYEKLKRLIETDDYSIAISNLLKGFKINTFFYGIGIPADVYSQKVKAAQPLVDFILGVEKTGKITKLYLKNNNDFFA